jgi:hypothetical protein
MVQVLELLEHERSSAVAACFGACDGVRLTGRAAVVDVAPRKVFNPKLVEIALQAHSRIKPLENPGSFGAPLEASAADSS